MFKNTKFIWDARRDGEPVVNLASRRDAMLTQPGIWVTFRSGFSEFGYYKASDGSEFTIMENNTQAQAVANGQNKNTSVFYMSNTINYAAIKDRTCRLVCEFVCDDYDSFDEVVSPDDASANLSIGLFSVSPMTGITNIGNKRTAKLDLTTKSTFLGRHVFEFVPSEAFAGQTESAYFSYNIGFRSTIDGLTIRVLRLDFQVKGEVGYDRLLFKEASYGGQASGGTLTQLGNGSCTLTSTAAASWSLLQNAYGPSGYFKTFSEMAGHTVRFNYRISWASRTSDASIYPVLMLCTNTTNSKPTRTKYVDLESDDEDGLHSILYTIPLTIDDWPRTDNSGGDVGNWFSWRFYLHSSSGSEVTISDIAVYDLGII